jgi:DNA-binding CsgD family transcriptional regulator
MATGLGVGGDVEQALENVAVPSYVLDTTGVVRWIAPAAEQLLGDIRGRHFTSRRRARGQLPRPRAVLPEVLGNSSATEATGVLVSTTGMRLAVELNAVALKNGERVVGVFGLIEGQSDDRPTAPHPHLTPRQVEVLRLLEQGRSTKQIAAELHLSTETVRTHIRRLLRALGVNSRLEAVAAARAAASPTDRSTTRLVRGRSQPPRSLAPKRGRDFVVRVVAARRRRTLRTRSSPRRA